MTGEFKHLMVDLETMGTGPESAIIAIAAVEFNIETGEIGKTFNKVISLDSCFQFGLKVDASTIMWWLKQSDEARMSVQQDDAEHLSSALMSFRTFCEKDSFIWGNSARFDLGILSNAYKAVGLPEPWNFRLERDVRTLVGFRPDIRNNCEFVGTPHNPIDDCLHQIKYCSEIWKSLNII